MNEITDLTNIKISLVESDEFPVQIIKVGDRIMQEATTKEMSPEEYATRKLERDAKTLASGTFIFHPFGQEGYLVNTKTGEIKYVCSDYIKIIKSEEEYHQTVKYKRMQDEQSKRVAKQEGIEEYIREQNKPK